MHSFFTQGSKLSMFDSILSITFKFCLHEDSTVTVFLTSMVNVLFMVSVQVVPNIAILCNWHVLKAIIILTPLYI